MNTQPYRHGLRILPLVHETSTNLLMSGISWDEHWGFPTAVTAQPPHHRLGLPQPLPHIPPSGTTHTLGSLLGSTAGPLTRCTCHLKTYCSSRKQNSSNSCFYPNGYSWGTGCWWDLHLQAFLHFHHQRAASKKLESQAGRKGERLSKADPGAGPQLSTL